MDDQQAISSFTGRRRRRRTRWSVRFGDVASRTLITVGGIGTILAVSGVAVFLLWVVWPLFMPAEAETVGTPAPEFHQGDVRPLHLAVDEFRVVGMALLDDGHLTTFRVDNGKTLTRRPLLDGPKMTVSRFSPSGDGVAFGFADGSVRLGTLGFRVEFLDIEGEGVPPELDKLDRWLKRHLPEGQVGELAVTLGEGNAVALEAVVPEGASHRAELILAGEAKKGEQFIRLARELGRKQFRSVLTRTPRGQFRFHVPELVLGDSMQTESDRAIELLDWTPNGIGGTVVAAFTADGKLRLLKREETMNMMTGEQTVKLAGKALPYEPPAGAGRPRWLLVNELGTNIYVAWEDGHIIRIDARSGLDEPVVAEHRDLAAGSGAGIAALEMMIGRTTLIVGESSGRVTAWFPAPTESAGTSDRRILKPVHPLAGPRGSAVTEIAPSSRSREVAIGYADGAVLLFHVSTENRLLSLDAGGRPVTSLLITPKDDGIVALAGDRMVNWFTDTAHPEATVRSLFAPMWYEDKPEAGYVWQSSSAGNAAEPKFSLTPLVWGTAKATFYSMLFAIPIALLAAIYTSEFLHPKVKGKIKPTIELMASLPSVVLGFLGGLVIAQFVENVVPAVLAGFFVLPLTFLVLAHLWQLLPQKATLILERARLLFVAGGLALGLVATVYAGPWAERILFDGDVMAWLKGNEPGQPMVGSATPGWFVLLIPAAAVLVALLFSRQINPRVRPMFDRLGRTTLALLQLLKFAASVAVVLALAWGLAMGLSALGADPRGKGWNPTGVYVQRNALIVGFMMGFAVIPIIYTIAEDALSTVPEHLRSASLGAGATPWQTAVRIVIPTAMSGLFSAVMIGLGRAVGETMIVLMAMGNTPLMDMNIFNGAQPLSAAIATEMPEAVRESTHYRTLFLAGLVLFLMTFVLNTVAEMVRLRFRKRAYQL